MKPNRTSLLEESQDQRGEGKNGEGGSGAGSLMKVAINISYEPLHLSGMTIKESIRPIDYCRHVRVRDRYDGRIDGSIDT
jgi:hypothetical protein